MLEGEVREAYRIWEEGASRMSLPELDGLPGSLIWDPSFEAGLKDSTFSWHFQPLVHGLSTGPRFI